MDDRVRNYVARLDRARQRPLADQLEDDLAPLRDLTLEERAQVVKAVCSAARRIIDARPDGDRILAYQDPLSPESESLWLRLVRGTARERGSIGRD
jgi:hypothetical protein